MVCIHVEDRNVMVMAEFEETDNVLSIEEKPENQNQIMPWWVCIFTLMKLLI